MILISDNTLPKEQLEGVRKSALDAGFGTWEPPTHSFGSGVYKGMGFKGNHSVMHILISRIIGSPIFPNSSFFRVLMEDEEKRLIHSDRHDGSLTAITYLSDHEEVSGTAFYRHKETGLLEMPSIPEMEERGIKDQWGEDMLDDSKWEQTDFVRGLFGRTLIFSAPLFHARVPLTGIGVSPEDSRMIHVVHFEI